MPGSGPSRRTVLRRLLAWPLVTAARPGRAQSLGQGEEHEVKAAFLYRFATYVDWPEAALGAPDTPFIFGVLGAQALAAALGQVVQGRQIGERRITVRELRPGEPLDGVHVLFIGRAEGPGPNLLATWLDRAPVLVVTESEGALGRGSMINFVVVERRVRFEIALDVAEKHGLRLSSRLLAVAQRVATGGP